MYSTVSSIMYYTTLSLLDINLASTSIINSTAFSIVHSAGSSSTTYFTYMAIPLVQQFKPPKFFRFPKYKFAKKGEQ